jgi:hypothetical protein
VDLGWRSTIPSSGEQRSQRAGRIGAEGVIRRSPTTKRRVTASPTTRPTGYTITAGNLVEIASIIGGGLLVMITLRSDVSNIKAEVGGI